MKKVLDRKDKKIIELQNTIDGVRRTLAYRDEKNAELTGELKAIRDKWNEYKQHIEGRELPAEAENRWLRETLRMVIVSADKFEALKVQDQNSLRYKL